LYLPNVWGIEPFIPSPLIPQLYLTGKGGMDCNARMGVPFISIAEFWNLDNIAQ
jgi:hypothetical protein